MTRYVLIFTALVSGLLLTQNSFAYDYFEGVEMATLEINGETFETPLKNGSDDRTQKFYMIKLALKGDEVAREMLLGGKDEVWIFIGKESPIWFRMDKVSYEVIKP